MTEMPKQFQTFNPADEPGAVAVNRGPAKASSFENAGQPLVFCGSADWMPRNFFRRVETVFPVEEPELRRRLIEEILPTELRDNVDARELQSDGAYAPPPRAAGEESFSAQKYFMAAATARAGQAAVAG